VKNPSALLTVGIEPNTNNVVSTSTDYTMVIQSNVPLSNSFYISISIPPEVGISSNLSCSSTLTNAICVGIGSISTSMINLTINSIYSTLVINQLFTFKVSSFVNPRSTAPSSLWNVSLTGIYGGSMGEISDSSTKSSQYSPSSNLVCSFDSTQNYFKANTQNVLIGCIFSNNLLQGDYIDLSFTSNSYAVNAGTNFSCVSLTSISCTVYF
jgi:hypothetical protein